MKKIFTIVTVFAILISLNSCNNRKKLEEKEPKYIFFLIGDGMGMSHINLTEAYLADVNQKVGVEHLTMSSFPVTGYTTTYAENRYITCSAAAGTALSTGFKTSISTIGLKSNHTDTLYSIAYYAKQKGMKIGILSSVGINHATPAAFYAHQKSRGQYYEIAMQMYKSNYDVFAGGGFIQPKGSGDSFPDMYNITKNNGYILSNNISEINNFTDKNKKYYLYSPEILSQAEFPYAIDQNDVFFTLADFTKKTIELLENENGFFIMVEGGKIDWASHDNDGATVVLEVLDFDEVVKAAYDFYLLHPDETLIIVTADHETGGLSIGCNAKGYDTDLELLKGQKMSLNFLSDTINKLDKAGKIKSFDDFLSIGETFLSITKESLTEKENERLKYVYAEYINNQARNSEGLYENNSLLAISWIEILNRRAGVGWTTHSHTGTPVPVFAIGVGSEKFTGFYDNTDIPKKIAELIDVKIPEK